MLLWAPGDLPNPDDPTMLQRIIEQGGGATKMGISAAVLVVILAVAIYLLKRLAKNRRTAFILTSFSVVGFVILTVWVRFLPETRGSIFILWHQLVRVGAALLGTGVVLGLMALMLPRVLDLMEARNFVQFVSARHVRADKSGFLTVISVLSIAGVAVGAFALCAVISIMGGFGADLKRKILGNNAHIRVDTENYGGFDQYEGTLEAVRVVRGVEAATPVVGGEAMASSSSNTAGVLVKGVETTSIGSVIELINNVEVGKFEYMTDRVKLANLPPDEPIGIGPSGEIYLKGPDSNPWAGRVDKKVEDVVRPEDMLPGLIVGRELAKTLHVYVGDEVSLVSPLGDLGPMGVMPRSRKFRIAAIFYSGMYEYDSSHAYMDMETAQEFLDLPSKITAIEVKVEAAEQVDPVTVAVEEAVAAKGLRVRDWKDLNKNLFSALKLEKIMTFIILSLAITVASFCIICTLLLMVTEKSKEIAILKAMGASDNMILRVFMSEGVIIGGIGTVFGVVTGLAATTGLKQLGVRLDPDVYYVDRLPISVDPFEYAMVAVCAILITTLATVYPAVAASRLRPVEGIRYE